MKRLLIAVAVGLFTVTAAQAGDYPSFYDGHWFHTVHGRRVHPTPNFDTIRDGRWYHEGDHYGNMGQYTRDRYGNFIEF
jgi:hypothetical protein